MMHQKPLFLICLTTGLLFLTAANACAHFGMLLAERNVVEQNQRSQTLTIAFAHPFAGIGMDMERPKRFFVRVGEQKQDLSATLRPTQFMKHQAWQSQYRFQRPGIYTFAVEPEPYWEAAEDIFIKHYSKTIISAYGDEEGWDRPLGLETEIVPLTRPFAGYSGSSFTGQVLYRSRPVPHAEVEVELYNQGRFAAPTPLHETLIVHADARGIFTFTCPQPGWWGFAALRQADYQLTGPDGKQKDVELGAVLWIYLDPWMKREQP